MSLSIRPGPEGGSIASALGRDPSVIATPAIEAIPRL